MPYHYPQIDFTDLKSIEGNPLTRLEGFFEDLAKARWKRSQEHRMGSKNNLWASDSHWAFTCPRRVVYKLMGLDKPFDGRSVCVFRTGDREEADLYGDLMLSGAEVRSTQLKLAIPHRIGDETIFIIAKLDGIIRVCEHTQAVLEFKTGSEYEIDKWRWRKEFVNRKPTGAMLEPEPSLGTPLQCNMGIAAINYGYIVKKVFSGEEDEEGNPILLDEPYPEACDPTSKPTALQELSAIGEIDGPMDTGCLIGLDKSSQVKRGLVFEYDSELYQRCVIGFETAWSTFKTGKNTISRGFEPIHKGPRAGWQLPKFPNGGCGYCPMVDLCWEPAGVYRPTKDIHDVRVERPDAPIAEALT